MQQIKYIFLVLIHFYAFDVFSQDDTLKLKSYEITQTDTLADKSQEGRIDTTIIYSANDTAVFFVKQKKMRLSGDSKIDYKTQKLNAEIIEIDFETYILQANKGMDSLGNPFGFPKFADNGEEYIGVKIKYNFKNEKGLIDLGETELTEGFYFGSKIKKVSKEILFIENGFYTACDNPIPDYHFGSSKMKLIANEKIFLDPVVFYIEEVPVFALPFGLYFPMQKDRQSGLILPSFYFSKDLGVVFKDLGFYWAASDYYDAQISVDFFTKGGYLFKNKSQWILKDVMNGNANIEFGQTRTNTDSPYSDSWRFMLSHNHTITPQDKIIANLNLSSVNFNRRTQTSIQERITQNISSSASYSKSFDNGASFSAGYNRNQNIIDETYTQSFPINLNLPNLTLAKTFNSKIFKPLDQDINYTYRMSATYNANKRVNYIKFDESDPLSTVDTNFYFDENASISHSPSISYNFPKLWNVLNITPSFNVRAKNYFRSKIKTYDLADSSVKESTVDGFYTEFAYDYALSLNTRFYGIMDDKTPLLGLIKPNLIGVKAFRHTVEPSISYSFSPNLSSSSLGYWASYYDYKLERNVEYNKFEADGGISSNRLSQRVNFGIKNTFDMKIAENDSVDTNYELLKMDLALNYDFAADSLNFSDIRYSYRTQIGNLLGINGSASFTLYDEDWVLNPKTKTYQAQRVNRLILEEGKNIARLTNMNFTLSTKFNSDGISFTSQDSQNQQTKDSLEAENSLGNRFLQRHYTKYAEPDWFADYSGGYGELNVPWSIDLSLTYNFSKPTIQSSNHSLNVSSNFNFDLTKSWHFQTSFNFDVINRELLTPNIALSKDLHCWELSARWTPSGFNQGFYLKFGLKASQLKDFKYEKQSNAIY